MRTSATTLVRKYKGREKVEQLEIGLKEKGRKDTRKMCSEGRRKKKPEARPRRRSKPMEAAKKKCFIGVINGLKESLC